jgi:hypothetical protein
MFERLALLFVKHISLNIDMHIIKAATRDLPESFEIKN